MSTIDMTLQPTMPTTKKVGFLTLPAELRNKIYRLATKKTDGHGVVVLPLKSAKVVGGTHLVLCYDPSRAAKDPRCTARSLFQVCKQVRKEARDLYYSENFFTWSFLPTSFESSESGAVRLAMWARAGLNTDLPKARLLRALCARFSSHKVNIRTAQDGCTFDVTFTVGCGISLGMSKARDQLTEALSKTITKDQEGRVAMTTESLLKIASLARSALAHYTEWTTTKKYTLKPEMLQQYATASEEFGVE